ncbi:MAG: chromosomal replication initiator protein DnaA [Clostridia bacterium]|nr:chromosomal replication initiator protein DnaA [Clostridia bacterium]
MEVFMKDTYNYQKLMDDVKAKAQEGIPSVAYNTWMAPLELLSIEGNVVTLVAPSSFFAEQLKSYEFYLKNCFKEVTQRNFEITYISQDKIGQSTNNSLINSQAVKSNLNYKFTFESFVIGENNRFAQAAALAVSEAPGTAYNPLFIYGGVGLGKTHLVQAVGNAVLERNPTKKVLYVTSEQFTNEFINGIQSNSNENFRQKYRNIDILIIDDIQFLAGKEGIQEEFFHTFNALRENNSQIILTSDKPPKDIHPLTERLKSRFLDGLLVDISSANYETRLAILRKKVELESIVIDDNVLVNIATRIDTNIRELEGTLKKIVAQASLTHSPITQELAEKAISDVIAHKEKVISADYIKETVSKYFNIDVADMNSSKRSNDIAFPRQIAMYLCRELAKMQYKNIGIEFGNRDHSTVMHACNKIEQEIKKNKDTLTHVDSVKNIILKPKEF